MSLSAKIDTSVTPMTLTVVSDRRVVAVSLSAVGETAEGFATFPIKLQDASGRVWKPLSDDGITAVFTG